MARMPKRSLVWVLLLAHIGCGPKNQDMLVAYVRGNYAYGVKPGTWDLNEVKECGMANRALLPDKRWDLLVCGAETQAAWDVVWLRSDTKSQILESASVVRHADRPLYKVRRARVTFSKISEARAVQMKGLGFWLWRSM
jgi:hypothetical protein